VKDTRIEAFLPDIAFSVAAKLGKRAASFVDAVNCQHSKSGVEQTTVGTRAYAFTQKQEECPERRTKWDIGPQYLSTDETPSFSKRDGSF
jgi:hypothetical protein